ncbi:conserved protein of unknown function [Candidatus Hydrogenisulfobacillus filiaventi]|uniref:Uncharacterized protein n=1 Tax=Candidatus Hydrogenisulfobacillus filiaventi TaxID=2707344 RepID=A0A6F8ZII6_9FIRM|nr:conserved protein of unknown function [Candidatus Hydrogenisulfobacillus filiaventi]
MEEFRTESLPAIPGGNLPTEDIVPIIYRIRGRGFEGPDPDDTPKDITGVVLGIKPSRWLPAEGGEGQAAVQCQLVGYGVGEWVLRPGDPDSPTERRECASCPANRWGSAVDAKTGAHRRGKACREKRLILFLRDQDAFPVVVSAPPTSIVPLKRWVSLMATRGVSHSWQVRVRLSVVEQRRGTEQWGVLRIETLENLDQDNLAKLAARLTHPAVLAIAAGWRAQEAASDPHD